MPDLFDFPDLTADMSHYRHGSSKKSPLPDGFLDLQADILEPNFELDGTRRQNFVNLESHAGSELEASMQKILCSSAKAVDNIISQQNRSLVIDPSLSALWIETSPSEGNVRMHRDSDDTDLVRATFSVSPTRILSSETLIEIDDDLWNRMRFPMGKVILDDQEDLIQKDLSPQIGIMTGTTYHRAPTKLEMTEDFKRQFGVEYDFSTEKVPRLFGSLWGKVN